MKLPISVRRTVAAGVTALMIALPLSAIPSAANAVTASGVDPSNDVSVGADDITYLGISLDHTTVTATIHTRVALPALSDPSWTKRIFLIQLEGGLDPNVDTAATAAGLTGVARQDVDDTRSLDYPSDNFGGIGVDGTDGTFAGSGSDHGDPSACDQASSNLSGTTLTLTAPASCFGNLGFAKVEAVSLDENTDPETADVAISADINSATSVDAAIPGGYYALATDGGVFSFGQAQFYGSTGSLTLNKPVVGMAPLTTNNGYRFVASDGGVFSYGSAAFKGSMGGKPLNQPIVGMANTPSGNGYWLVASDGGIFAFGDAAFYGSTGSIKLNQPIVGMTPTASGHGYWLVARDGGIFAYGDAAFYGSAGSIKLNQPIVGMAKAPAGNGYWLVAKDGGIFSYGSAPFYGSGVDDYNGDVVGIQASNGGYDLVGSAGDVFAYGPAYDYGDPYRYNVILNQPLVGLATIS